MHAIIYYIGFFIALGGIGMAIANRKVDSETARKRWLKYFTYILFTGIVIASIFLHFFPWLSLLIVIITAVELVQVAHAAPDGSMGHTLVVLFLFAMAASGFIFYAFHFTSAFLLFIYFQVLVFDGFCQVCGQLIGRHALVPGISPTKTVEGLAGGWLFCILASLLAAAWVDFSLVKAGLYGLLTGGLSFCGDLLASWYKRKVKVKDYSNWLPGQGGFLDRFDSLIMTGCVYYLLYLFI
ncbi:MAG TPA: phosphatidate cytidylyltransferase [Chitinophagaceae bacterium]|nr:phosphatidate cytidylyltransferase [Chitinophagaceae bacterium]